jgi:hypothetical protein
MVKLRLAVPVYAKRTGVTIEQLLSHFSRRFANISSVPAHFSLRWMKYGPKEGWFHPDGPWRGSGLLSRAANGDENHSTGVRCG